MLQYRLDFVPEVAVLNRTLMDLTLFTNMTVSMAVALVWTHTDFGPRLN